MIFRQKDDVDSTGSEVRHVIPEKEDNKFIMSKFENKLDALIEEFSNKLQSIEDGIRRVPVSENSFEDVLVTKSKLNSAFSLLTKRKNISEFADTLQDHFAELNPSIVMCSSPRGFRTAWGLRSKTLSILDAEAISNDGGQLIPVNENSRLLKCEQQGVVLGPKKKLVLAVRHSEGNYDDSLDELGRFVYQPPRDVSGMLRYRWCQFLSSKLNVPYIVLVVMWFEYRLNDKINQLFVLAPAKLINLADDLSDLNASLHNPLKLQLVPRHEANAAINLIKSLNNETIDIDVRPELTDALAREWAYDKINNTSKGKQIKRWAQNNSLVCPGEVCNHVPFVKLEYRDIAFGHIVSQNWSSAFTFMLDKVHHPDNLYLTCKRCNSSLSDNFPDKKLKENVTNQGTIGDWIRNNESSIRES